MAFDFIVGSKFGDFYDGEYRIKKFEPRAADPVAGLEMWDYILELVYVAGL